MLPASNRGAGQCLGFPDVCNTPAGPATLPIPYANIGMNAQAQGFSQVVKVSGVNALNLGSTITTTMGDEAGTAHPTVKGAVTYTTGDAIVSIDRLPAITLTSPTTQNNMNNTAGAVLVPSAVNVTFSRRGEPSDLDELADAMGRPSVAGSERLPGDVLMLRIPHCGPDLVACVCAHISRGSVRGLVLDLRGNPGGELEAAIALLCALLGEGDVVARVVEADGDERAVRSPGPPTTNVPVVVLVDGGTASAAELVASSLKDHGRAVVVGERTHGKATLQILMPGKDGVERCTAGRWLSPRGREVDGVGVKPDVVIHDPAEAERLAWSLVVRASRARVERAG